MNKGYTKNILLSAFSENFINFEPPPPLIFHFNNLFQAPLGCSNPEWFPYMGLLTFTLPYLTLKAYKYAFSISLFALHMR